jgi:hypothetical protein
VLTPSQVAALLVDEPDARFEVVQDDFERVDLGIQLRARTAAPNISDYAGDGRQADAACCEQALNWPLANVRRIGVERMNPDNLAALAVLENRNAGRPVDQDLVKELSRYDMQGIHAVRESRYYDAIVALIVLCQSDLDTAVRIVLARRLLEGRMPATFVAECGAIYRRHLGELRAQLRVSLMAGGRIAHIVGNKAAAFECGYDYADILLIEYCEVGTSGRIRRYTLCKRARRLPPDLLAVREELSALDAECPWEGKDIIISSAYDRSSALAAEQVGGVVAKHLL